VEVSKVRIDPLSCSLKEEGLFMSRFPKEKKPYSVLISKYSVAVWVE
jgi:hypothetical protein